MKDGLSPWLNLLAAGRRLAVRLLPGALLAGLVVSGPVAHGDRVPLGNGPRTAAKFLPGELLVKHRTGISGPEALAALAVGGLASAEDISELGVARVLVPPGEEERRAAELRSLPGVEYAEPNYIAEAADAPNDPDLAAQWALSRIGAAQAWDLVHGSTDVILAVVDTGIEGGHGDLHDKLLAGYDYVAGHTWAAGESSDDHGHGTHVAGIAAAVTDNGLGVAGMSWGARLMPVKVLGADGRGSYENVALGIRYAANHGANVINLSLGADEDSQTLREAVDYAVSRGCLVVAAAGNQDSNAGFYPAAYPNVIAVGSVDDHDARSWFSNWGPMLDVMAPGEYILSTYPSNSYDTLSGTSMAAPFVSGLSALMWSACPGDSPDYVRRSIETSAADLGAPGWDEDTGYGRIDAAAALRRYFFDYELSVAPESLLFLADDSSGPLTRGLRVAGGSRCSAASALTWTAVVSPTSASWLQVSPSSGLAADWGGIDMTAGVDRTGLGYGEHEAQLDISSDNGITQASISLPVRLVYLPALQIQYLGPIYRNSVP